MILAAMTIENYKQFAGAHEIDFPSMGIVGILGANGAGKTTLFEAIEWCLYNPRGIENLDVVPRGTAARTRVRVTLEDPHEGVRYVVERSLRGGKSSRAELYREDDPENRITQGPREVTGFVASRLVGLDHAAFVSTFFTRQKELNFFGGLGATERRVAVAKLLGYETIRQAQGSLGKQRTQARNAADALRAQYEEESAGRDFVAELQASDERVRQVEQSLIAIHDTVEKASAALATASQEAERWRAVERQDAALQAQLSRIAGHIQTGEARRDNATSGLADLDRQAVQRAKLAPVAEQREAREQQLAEHDAARTKYEQTQRLKDAMHRAETGQHRTGTAAGKTVTGADASAIDQWLWRDDDATDPIAAISRLRGVAETLDQESARNEVRLFERLIQQAKDHEEKQGRHKKCLQTLAKLESDIAEITAAKPPEEEIAVARQQRENALVTVSGVEAEIKALTADRKRLENLVAVLKRTSFDDPESVCPTCQRPFAADDAEATIDALNRNIAASRQGETSARQREGKARQSAEEANRQISEAENRQQRLTEARDRLSKGQGITTGAEQDVAAAHELLANTLRDSTRTAVPAAAELAASEQHLARLERIARAANALGQIEAEARQYLQDAREAEETLTALGPVDYDETRHQETRQSLHEARDATTRIQEIDKRLARRPELEAALESAAKDLAAASSDQVTFANERKALNFASASLETAIATESAARAAERDALDQLSDMRTAVADAQGRRQRLIDESDRIQNLARRADTMVHEHETLNQIYDEFTAFDRYVANRVTPYLAEQTGELLATVTDGRYDQVQFDTDYGLRVFDGPIDSFPMSAFSGGERDIVALCARLALSRVVGAQAANPPSFLVLDEVFGALDQDRRAQVLQTLGVLSGTAEAYRQLFIISHVDDIRHASIFDEVWRISEGPDGSYVERVDQLGTLEEA